MNQVTSGVNVSHYSRNETVAIAKAIGILLMVLGHSGCPAVLSNFLSFYHMPLFFFLSGFFFNIGFREDYKPYIVKKIKSLWLPFVKWSLIFLAFHNVLYYCCLETDLLSIKDILLRLFQIPFMFGNDQLLGGYWFLNDLFYVTIFTTVFFIIFYYINKSINPLVLLSFYSVFSFIVFLIFISLSFNSSNRIIIVLAKYSYSLITFVLGIILANTFKSPKLEKVIRIISPITNSWFIIIAAFVLLLLGAFYYPASRSAIGSLSTVAGLYMLVMALIGIYFTCAIAHKINNKAPSSLKRHLVFIGDSTLIILTWHFLSFKIVSFVYVLIRQFPLRMAAEHPTIHAFSNRGGWFLYFIVGAIVPIMIAYYKRQRINR